MFAMRAMGGWKNIFETYGEGKKIENDVLDFLDSAEALGARPVCCGCRLVPSFHQDCRFRNVDSANARE